METPISVYIIFALAIGGYIFIEIILPLFKPQNTNDEEEDTEEDEEETEEEDEEGEEEPKQLDDYQQFKKERAQRKHR